MTVDAIRGAGAILEFQCVESRAVLALARCGSGRKAVQTDSQYESCRLLSDSARAVCRMAVRPLTCRPVFRPRPRRTLHWQQPQPVDLSRTQALAAAGPGSGEDWEYASSYRHGQGRHETHRRAFFTIRPLSNRWISSARSVRRLVVLHGHRLQVNSPITIEFQQGTLAAGKTLPSIIGESAAIRVPRQPFTKFWPRRDQSAPTRAARRSPSPLTQNDIPRVARRRPASWPFSPLP